MYFVEGSRALGPLTNLGFESVEVVDPLTVEYHLSRGNAAFPDLLRGASTTMGYPISRVAYEADPEGYGEHPVGTGPFEFKEWSRDDHLTVTRNPDYWLKASNGDQLPYLDEIVFRPIPDEDSRVQGFAAGDLDVVQSSRGTHVQQIFDTADKNGWGRNLYAGSSAAATYLNVLVPPLDDVRVRQALAYAGDINALAEIFGDAGLTESNFQAYSQDSPWYSEKVDEAYPEYNGRDVDKAKELLDEYKNDPARSDGKSVGAEVGPLRYQCPTDPSQVRMSEMYQGLWGEIGIDVIVVTVDESTLVSQMVGSSDQNPPFSGDYDASCTYTGGGETDPVTYLLNSFGPIATTPGNITNYTNPKIDELRDKLMATADFDERYELFEEAGLILAEEVPLTWGSKSPIGLGFVDKIVTPTPWETPDGNMVNVFPEGFLLFHEVSMVK